MKCHACNGLTTMPFVVNAKMLDYDLENNIRVCDDCLHVGSILKEWHVKHPASFWEMVGRVVTR